MFRLVHCFVIYFEVIGHEELQRSFRKSIAYMLLGIPTELVSELCNFSSASVALRDSNVSRIGNLVGAHVPPFFRVLTKPVKQTRSK